MPNPVYVRDAQERPLLPTSSAYGRVLLRSGKARRIPHPALQIIQLTHPISQPAAKPLLLVVEHRGVLAEMLVVMERAEQPVVFHRFLLDLELSAALCPDPLGLPTVLHGVRRGLSHLLPISDLIISQAAGRSVSLAPETLADNASRLLAVLPTLRAEARHRPALAAVWVTQALAASRMVANVGHAMGHVLPRPIATVGSVVRIASGTSYTIGLVTALQGASCVVQVPTTRGEERLHWQTEVVPMQALQHSWRPTEVTLLPLREVARG